MCASPGEQLDGDARPSILVGLLRRGQRCLSGPCKERPDYPGLVALRARTDRSAAATWRRAGTARGPAGLTADIAPPHIAEAINYRSLDREG